MVQFSQFTQSNESSFREPRRVAGNSISVTGMDSTHIATLDRLNVQVEDVNAYTCVKFSPFEGSEHLLAAGSDEKGKLSIFNVTQSSENPLSAVRLHDIEFGDHVNSLAWSPETACIGRNIKIKLAISLFNQKEVHIVSAMLRVCNTNSEASQANQEETHSEANEEVEVEQLERHICQDMAVELSERGVINDLAFEPFGGQSLASVGSDKLCYIWDVSDRKMVCIFKLTSAGQSVKWSPVDPGRLLVGEKCGIVRLYDLNSRIPLMSFSANKCPLNSVDWCRHQPSFIAGVAGSELLFWQLGASSLPVERLKSHQKGADELQMYNEHLYATRGRPRSQVVIYNHRINQLLLEEEVKAGAGLSWHAKVPILAVGSYKKIILYQLNAFS